MKTIKQIADEIGIEKQRVYRYINKNHINDVHHDAGVMYINDVVEILIKRHFSTDDNISDLHHDMHQSTSNDIVIDTVVEMLKEELRVKNEQISELNNRLSESNAALVTAQQSVQAAQALHAGTIQLIDGTSSNWFSRLFKKKKNGDNT